jgi:D-alanyl-D-alanine-carboxypeptidase/D-alanyl-D-alanine-endopeptidase
MLIAARGTDGILEWPPMAWSEDAAGPLAETFDGVLGAPGAVIAAACIDAAGTTVAAGPRDTPADGRFEIGSITKTMTATMLALLAADGALRLDDEASRWLSAGANGGITLRQLATHTSGLPRLGPNMPRPAADPLSPYAGYGFEQAEEGLRQAVPAPGTPWLYSNFGYHLLGLVLERASGRSYQALLADRLLEPLAMTCSGVESDGIESHADGISLPGHALGGEVPHWDHPLGAGGVESTIGDLARYASACLHPAETPLGAAIAAALAPQLPLTDGRQQALAWLVLADGSRAHEGGTGGFSSAVLIDPGRGRAVAMLASTADYTGALGHAGRLALAGGDPRAARPQPPGPEWDERVREIVQWMLDGRTEDVRSRMTSALKDAVSAEQMDRVWRAQTRDLGQAGPVTVTCQRAAGHVVAHIGIAFANGAVALRMAFEPSAQIIGLRFLPPPEEPAPLPD